MRYYRNTILLRAAVFWILLTLTAIMPAMAQMSSTTYRLPAVSQIGGGGLSGSTNYQLIGSIPLVTSGRSSSTGYILNGGPGGAIFETGALKYTYGGTDPMTVTAFTDHQVELTISGTTGADSACTFYYRQGGNEAFAAQAMTKVGGGVFRYTVPGAQLGLAGMEYYFKARIGSDSLFVAGSGDPYAFICSMTNAQAQRPTAMPDGKYRIIGVPINITGMRTVEAVFTDDLGTPDKKQWRLGSYDNGEVTEYPAAANATEGRGYWLAARGAKKYGAAGLSTRPNYYIDTIGYYRITLDTGWNQVANPFPFNIDWPEMRFEYSGTFYDYTETSVLDSVAYYYNGSAYVSTGVISRWDGVFIYSKRTNVRALFPFRVSGIVPIDQSLPRPLVTGGSVQSWAIHLAIEANGLLDDANYIGAKSGAIDGPDDYDMHEPPPAPDGPSLAFLIPGDKGPRRIDIRSPFNSGAGWDMILNQVPNRILKINDLSQLPKNMSCWMILDNGSKIQIEESQPIELADNTKTARIIIGTDEYLKENGSIIMPTQYTLYQNYPNPFNPTTNIKFALPKSGTVQLDIFNILGQKVVSLVDGALPAGQHTVSWDGTDAGGNPVGSGVYFYRLKTGNFEQSRKMQLLK
jgi:hypothetical protein